MAAGGASRITRTLDRSKPQPEMAAMWPVRRSAARKSATCRPTRSIDWSTPKALRAWLEDRAGRVERGELDLPAVPTKLAEIARATHNDEALEKLDGLEALIKQRLTGGG